MSELSEGRNYHISKNRLETMVDGIFAIEMTSSYRALILTVDGIFAIEMTSSYRALILPDLPYPGLKLCFLV